MNTNEVSEKSEPKLNFKCSTCGSTDEDLEDVCDGCGKAYCADCISTHSLECEDTSHFTYGWTRIDRGVVE